MTPILIVSENSNWHRTVACTEAANFRRHINTINERFS